MINIKVIEAKNLPVYNNHLRKSIIACFSISSYRYFHGEFKNNKKTTNPQWNVEFNIDLFRLIDLSFSIYGYRYKKKNILVGIVSLNFLDFISKPPGNQILSNPQSSVEINFPIKSSDSQNATLTVLFTFIPIVYSPIRFNPAAYLDTTINIWTSYSPPLNIQTNPVEIELLQSFYFQQQKTVKQFGIYYNYTKDISWQSIGKSSYARFFHGQTGLSQIHSLSVSKLSGKYTFFILNVSNYTGKVTLNFILEKRGKNHVFDNIKYMKPKKKHPKIGILKTIDIDVTANKKYCVPFYFYYKVNSSQSYSYEFNLFSSESIQYNKPNSNLSYSDRISSEIDFNFQISNKLHLIQNVANVDFLRTNILPLSDSISLSKTLKDYNLQTDENFELRIYVGGYTTTSTQYGSFRDYWNQGFCVFDKQTGKKCSNISELLKSTEIKEYNSQSRNSFLPTKFECNYIQTLNLNEIGRDKILVYFVESVSPLAAAYPSGFNLISHIVNNSETLLFYNPIVTDVVAAHCFVCFRIEYVENDWHIISMKRFCKDQKQLRSVIESMHANNWRLPENEGNLNVNLTEATDDEIIQSERINTK